MEEKENENKFVKESNNINIDVVEVDKNEDKSEDRNDIVTEISLKDFGKKENYIKFPSEIDTESEAGWKINQLITKSGKWNKDKSGKEFWSGLLTRDAKGNTKDLLDEFYLKVNKDGQSALLKLISWEPYYKFLAIARHLQSKGMNTIGFEIIIKRIDKVSYPVDGNIILTLINKGVKYICSGPRGNYQVVEENIK